MLEIKKLEEFEILLNGIEKMYAENKSRYSADNVKYCELYKRVWNEAVELDSLYFNNSAFGFGNIEEIDNKF